MARARVWDVGAWNWLLLLQPHCYCPGPCPQDISPIAVGSPPLSAPEPACLCSSSISATFFALSLWVSPLTHQSLRLLTWEMGNYASLIGFLW